MGVLGDPRPAKAGSHARWSTRQFDNKQIPVAGRAYALMFAITRCQPFPKSALRPARSKETGPLDPAADAHANVQFLLIDAA
jgi:hypothetical protein